MSRLRATRILNSLGRQLLRLPHVNTSCILELPVWPSCALHGIPTRRRQTPRNTGSHLTRRRTVFSDEKALLLDDPDHSDTEDRFILLGLSTALRILVVVHAYQDKAEQIRLISARKATPTERAGYDKGTGR